MKRHFLMGAHVWAYFPLVEFGEKGLLVLYYKGRQGDKYVFEGRGNKVLYYFSMAHLMRNSLRLRPFLIDSRVDDFEVVL